MQTITTVGYGDIIPKTLIGKIIGFISMFSALAITSLFTASTTSSLITSFQDKTQKASQNNISNLKRLENKIDSLNNNSVSKEDINDIKNEINEIKDELNNLKK